MNFFPKRSFPFYQHIILHNIYPWFYTLYIHICHFPLTTIVLLHNIYRCIPYNIHDICHLGFVKVAKFFEDALEDHGLQLKLRQQGNVFFLHLLGQLTHLLLEYVRQYKSKAGSPLITRITS